VRSFANVPQIGAAWLEENRAKVMVLDVREPAEFDGELGHIEGSTLLPIGQLRARIAEIPRDRPVVCVCRSGGRSAQAALIREGAGIKDVANLDGGLIAWRGLDRKLPAPPH
jgi:rhodanese-related sulfurtransferase